MNNVRYEDNRETQVLTPAMKIRNNKEMRNNIQILQRTAEPIKMNINPGSEYINILQESERVQNSDNMNTKERKERNNSNALELKNTRKSSKKIACSENKTIIEGEVSVRRNRLSRRIRKGLATQKVKLGG